MTLRPLLVLGLLLGAATPALGAQETSERPPAAFSMVEAKRFAGVALLGGAAYTLDDLLRDAVRRDGIQQSDLLEGATVFGNFYGQPGVVALGLGLWGGGLIAKRPTIAASGLRAIEAITVSGFVTKAIKETAGRARPHVSPRRTDWQLLRGARTPDGDFESMASGHATAAFAFASAVTDEVRRRAPEHARWVGVTTYSLAAVTAYARMHDNRHWFSDVTVGAGVGIVTAKAITRWHATRPENVIDRWFLRPTVTASPFGGLQYGVEFVRR